MEEILSKRPWSEDKPPRSVLFVCNQNAVRSPMAQGLATHHWKRRIFVDSVGLIEGLPDPFSVAAMQEIGVDISAKTPRALADIEPGAFDVIVALTPESWERIQALEGLEKTGLEYWPTFDPGDREGSRDQVLDAYRRVRDQLEARIGDLYSFH